VLAVTLGGCDGGTDTPDGAGALTKVTYLTSFGTFGQDAYAYVAKEKGFFAEAGFDVDIKPGNGTGDNVKLIVSGQAMYTPVDMTGGILQLGRGEAKDFTAVAAIQQRTMAAILSLDGAGITRPQDLEGRRIADTGGSVVRSLFPTYARLTEVDAAKVTWVNTAAQGLIGALADGSVDGIGQFVVAKPTVEAATKGRKRAVVLPYSDVLTDLYGNVLITSTANARQDPAGVRRFTAALLKGLAWAVAHPEESGQILARHVPKTDAGAAAAELQLMAGYVRTGRADVPLGHLDSERVARSIAILQGAGAINGGLTPERVMSLDLVP
jgi:NitT/TauT family transport system substrate-binding protein